MQDKDKPTEASAVELDESELGAVTGGFNHKKIETSAPKAGKGQTGAPNVKDW